jgi:hypothetical protein
MDSELKSKLMELTVGEVLELFSITPKQKVQPWNRYTIGKLDASLTTISDSRNNIIEYRIIVPEGILCHIKSKDSAESCIKEINIIINKYQK